MTDWPLGPFRRGLPNWLQEYSSAVPVWSDCGLEEHVEFGFSACTIWCERLVPAVNSLMRLGRKVWTRLAAKPTFGTP